MPNKVKSLRVCCQESLTKSLDVLTEVGCVPYGLLKDSLKHATPQQLYRIEHCNPDLARESDELWLKHCLLFKDIRDDFEQGLHRDSSQWRELYLTRYKENERKRQAIKERVANQYSKIKSEKAARSIKVLNGIVPITKRHSYEAARQSTMSKLFQQTKREANKVASIYNQQPKRSVVSSHHSQFSNVIRTPKPPSKLIQAYHSNHANFPRSANRTSPPLTPLVAPQPTIYTPKSEIQKEKHYKRPKLHHDQNTMKSQQLTPQQSPPQEKKPRSTAIVNFDIFKEDVIYTSKNNIGMAAKEMRSSTNSRASTLETGYAWTRDISMLHQFEYTL